MRARARARAHTHTHTHTRWTAGPHRPPFRCGILGVPPGSSQTRLSVTLNTSGHCALSRAPRSCPGQGDTLTGLSLATPSPQLASTLGHVLFLKQAAGEGTCGSISLALGSFPRLLTSYLLRTTTALLPGCSQRCSAQPRDPPC